MSLVYAFELYNCSVQSILPRLKIHTWGGLGSQLYAVALAVYLSEQFPRRKLQVVLHTGGVTRRNPEVMELFPSFEYSYQDDFNHSSKSKSGEKIPSGSNVRLLIKKMLLKLHFVSHCNNDKETRNVRFWTLSIRGHYSYRNIDRQFLFMLRDALKVDALFDDVSAVCSIHYRLGDLLSLDEKSPISENCVRAEYFKVNKGEQFNETLVFSDSPTEARARFSKFISQNLHTPEASTQQVIASAIQSAYFIGTSSKISFWIASIRAICFGSQSSLPSKNFPQYKGLFQDGVSLISPYVTD